MSERTQITLVQKKIIKSLLYGLYDIMNIFYARIHTCGKNAEYWLYSGLEGALVYCIDMRVKSCRFLMIDLKSYEIVFDCELYKKFDKAYKKGTERFYYFEVENGFIGFEIPNMEQAEILSASIISFGDDYIKKKLREYKVMKENEIKEKARNMIELLEKKLNQENAQPKMLRAEIVLKHGLLEKMINTVELNDETGKIIVKGNGYNGVDSDLLKLKGLDLDLKTQLKIGDGEIFTKYISRNILRSYMKGLIIPKRKINRGEGVKVGNIPQYEDNNAQEIPKPEEQEKIVQKRESKVNLSKRESKVNLPKRESKANIPIQKPQKIPEEKPNPKPEPPKQKPPSPPKPPKNEIIEEQKEEIIEKKREEIKKEKKVEKKVEIKEEKKEQIREPSPPKQVEVVVQSNSKGIPPPPPPPPPPPVVKTVKDTSSKPSKPVDLMAELAAKKKNLAKVETKDLSIPNVQKADSSSSQPSNSMMAAILAQRNAMKKGSGTQNPPISQPKPQPKKPAVQPQPPKNIKKNENNAPKKPPVASKKPPTSNKPQEPLQKVNTVKKSVNSGAGAKPPMKMSGGGAGGFAALRNALANRMGPPQQAKKDEGPKKPIVELGTGNVPKMNISKLMASLEKNMSKNENENASNEPAEVISGSGPGIPPPPPPPPPPPSK